MGVFRQFSLDKLHTKQFAKVLQVLAPSLKPQELQLSLQALPCDADGRISVDYFLDWLYRSPSQTACWQQAWEALYRERTQQQLRRRSILMLTVLAEPLQREWNEVFIDVAWSSWSEAYLFEKRQRSLPKGQRCFEQTAEAAAAVRR